VGFGHTLFGEVDVGPAGEAVLFVPRAFAVAQEDDFVHDLPSRLVKQAI
jgi:hypothetical protein